MPTDTSGGTREIWMLDGFPFTEDANQDRFHQNFIYSRYLSLGGQNIKEAMEVLP